jgi:D-sedoheptulose 7-phosphate isomerase
MTYSTSYLKSMADVLSSSDAALGGSVTSLEEGLTASVSMLKDLQARGGTQFFFGNGASAAFADHMALDWTKNGGIRSMSLSSTVLMTALANDIDFNAAFAMYLERFAKPGDVVTTISSSGNSPNVLKVIETARQLGCHVLTLSGLKPDNKSRKAGDVNFYVPGKTYGIVECAHQVLLHMILDSFMGIEEWNRDGYQNMNVAQFQL